MEANYTPSTEGKAQELCEKLYFAAKRSKTRRFHALFDKVHRRDFLVQAWEKVMRNRGTSGIDGENITDIIEQSVNKVINEIQQELKRGKYHPRKVERVYIPKPDGGERPLGIPTVRDRIVQTATKEILGSIYEADFLDCNYGFRPNKSAHDAKEKVRETMNEGYTVVFDADIKEFFDNVDHEILLDLVRQRISDRRILKLIRKWLKSEVMDSGRVKKPEKGTPQGGVISPLLANIYLHEFDKFWRKQNKVNGKLVRYADDFVIMFRTKEEAEEGQRLVEKKLEELGLKINQQKTEMVDARKGKEGFTFLGFYFRRSKSWTNDRYYTYLRPSKKAKKSFRRRIRNFLGDKSKLQWTLQQVVDRLNSYIRGWMNYFKFGNSTEVFHELDSYVHQMVAIWYNSKQQKTGRRWKSELTWKEFKETGIQIMGGSVEYWSTYSKAQE